MVQGIHSNNNWASYFAMHALIAAMYACIQKCPAISSVHLGVIVVVAVLAHYLYTTTELTKQQVELKTELLTRQQVLKIELSELLTKQQVQLKTELSKLLTKQQDEIQSMIKTELFTKQQVELQAIKTEILTEQQVELQKTKNELFELSKSHLKTELSKAIVTYQEKIITRLSQLITNLQKETVQTSQQVKCKQLENALSNFLHHFSHIRNEYHIITSINDVARFCSYKYAKCAMDTDGERWIVIQRRINGTIDFDRDWTEYESGFGDLDGEFWYGLYNIHLLTSASSMKLRIELGSETETSVVWTYGEFQVDEPVDGYRLTVGKGMGTAGSQNGMLYCNGETFSTRDYGNSVECADIYGGGWWYKSFTTHQCSSSNLNGKYYYNRQDGTHWKNSIISWEMDEGNPVHFSRVIMKIRPHT